MPELRIDPVRHVDRAEAERTLGRRARLSRERRRHRVQEGQRHHRAETHHEENVRRGKCFFVMIMSYSFCAMVVFTALGSVNLVRI